MHMQKISIWHLLLNLTQERRKVMLHRGVGCMKRQPEQVSLGGPSLHLNLFSVSSIPHQPPSMNRATLNEFFQPPLKPEIVFFAAAIQRAGEKRPQDGNGAVNWGRTGVTGFGWSPTLANTFNLDTVVQIFLIHIHCIEMYFFSEVYCSHTTPK